MVMIAHAQLSNSPRISERRLFGLQVFTESVVLSAEFLILPVIH